MKKKIEEEPKKYKFLVTIQYFNGKTKKMTVTTKVGGKMTEERFREWYKKEFKKKYLADRSPYCFCVERDGFAYEI